MSPRRRDHPPGPTATDQLAAALRQRVLSGALGPGEALREEELSERTGHSRHTVRAALARLADERVVELVPYRGARVTRFGDDDVRALQQLRGALEGEAVRLARDRYGDAWPASVLAPVEAAVDALAATGAADPDDWPAVATAHAGVHQALVEVGGSARISEAHARLHSEVLLVLVHVRPAYSVDSLVTEHRDYLRQVQARGEEAVREHLEHSTRLILGAREG